MVRLKDFAEANKNAGYENETVRVPTVIKKQLNSMRDTHGKKAVACWLRALIKEGLERESDSQKS